LHFYFGLVCFAYFVFKQCLVHLIVLACENLIEAHNHQLYLLVFPGELIESVVAIGDQQLEILLVRVELLLSHELF
jgi:hypothetical protein